MHELLSSPTALVTLGLLCLPLLGCDLPLPGGDKPAASSQPTASAPPSASATSTEAALDDRARRIAKRLLFVDGHVDLPHRLYEGRDEQGHTTEDVSRQTAKGDFDYVRAHEGGLDAPFMSIYVPSKLQQGGGAKKRADELIDLVEGLASAHPARFALARTVEEVRHNFGAGRISLPMGIENGAALEGDLDNLAHFYRRGVRYVTLAHATDNDLSDSSYDDHHTHGGLSPLGRQAVEEMNRLGIMIDVSHISDDAFWQVVDLSKAPVIASHSSCRHFTPGFERNMSDEMIARLAARGGVVMINFGSSFLDEEAQKQSSTRWKARQAFMADGHYDDMHHPAVEKWNEAYDREHPPVFATVETVADHIEHVIEIAGSDHVGVGSDFDGVGDSLPVGLKDASELPNLVKVLLQRGHTEAEIAKIASGNVLRVWRAVELHARATPGTESVDATEVKPDAGS